MEEVKNPTQEGQIMRGADIAGFSCLLLIAAMVSGVILGLIVGGVLGDRETAAITERVRKEHPDDPLDGIAYIYIGYLFMGGVAGTVVGTIGGIFLSLTVAALGTLKSYAPK
jgi:hypothetical protein